MASCGCEQVTEIIVDVVCTACATDLTDTQVNYGIEYKMIGLMPAQFSTYHNRTLLNDNLKNLACSVEYLCNRCDPGLPLPNAGGWAECVSGTLMFYDLSSVTHEGMTVAANAVSIQVTDGVVVSPPVIINVGDATPLNTAGLSALNTPWTIMQTVTATVCGQIVQKTFMLDRDPCV